MRRNAVKQFKSTIAFYVLPSWFTNCVLLLGRNIFKVACPPLPTRYLQHWQGFEKLTSYWQQWPNTDNTLTRYWHYRPDHAQMPLYSEPVTLQVLVFMSRAWYLTEADLYTVSWSISAVYSFCRGTLKIALYSICHGNIFTESPLKVGGPCNFSCASVYVLFRISQSFTV